ncbi:DUF4139 domain-containing protein [Thermoflexibacter ruber]|uniref:Uncharacterized protein n=1 Tax=Thermoflexibacter ruber TaxID=1003 RepID=A0A1I2HG48_9BACT|nr:DUF4139 domain-containing protein [Thermoflexibacter ruber]SFF27471.1 hypothetical protein SAMN04488541_102327 [Thermoflexibacter ruber]
MKFIRLFTIFLFYMNSLIAQQSDIAVFKNGTAFLVKKMQINAENGTAILPTLPQATFGTLWFLADNNAIKQVSSFTEELNTSLVITNVADMLKANQGKKAIFVFDNNVSVEGVLESVSGTAVLIRTNAGKYYTNDAQNCKSAEFSEKPNTLLTQKENKRIVKLEFAKKNTSQPLQMMYLAKGLSWVPSYHIDLLNETQAKVTLRATLMNDLEDLENANLNLVVGVPNFAYSYLSSPLVSTEGVVTFLNQLNRYSNQYYGGGGRTGAVSRGDISMQSFSNVMSSDVEGEDEDLPSIETEGKQSEDFFFYQLKNVTLKKQGRTFQDILQQSTTYEHLYEVNLNSNNTSSYTNPNESTYENISLVKHAVMIKNESKFPWTTGTVLLTKLLDGVAQPISQDKLNYTPVGGKVKIPLTVVSDVSVKDSEKEVDRKVNIKQKDGYFYDLVTVEAKIEVKSFRNNAIELKINRSFTGEGLKCNIAWNIQKLVSTNSYNYNALSSAEWKIKLEAGKSETITYQYQFYVRK